MTSMKTAFAAVYERSEWHCGSGPGSGEAETAVWREFLRKYMIRNNVRSVLDLGCGDWQWARLMDWTGIAYHGIDVVPTVIDECREKYAGSGITFRCADITSCPLPAAELVLCKEVLQHWPVADIHRFRKRMQWRRVLLVNDYAPVVENPDIAPGGYRPLDLAAPPFGWAVTTLMDYTLCYPDGSREMKVVQEL